VPWFFRKIDRQRSRESLRFERTDEGDLMRRRECRKTGQNDLSRARPGQIAGVNHALAKLSAAADWGFSGRAPELSKMTRRAPTTAREPHGLARHLRAPAWPIRGRNDHTRQAGDAINAVLAAAGCNARRLLAWLALLWPAIRMLPAIRIAFTPQSCPEPAHETA
jgi:hypothetical protein